MKNYIDNKFYNLVKKIEKNDVYNIYINIVKNFSSLNIATQKSIEDFLNKFNYWGNIDISECNYEVFYKKASLLKNNLYEYIWLYENLEDYKSKYILFSILNNFYCLDFNNLSNSMERIYKHYFDLDIMPNLKNEIFADIGAYTGDSILDFIFTYGENAYKKIYCYEMSENNMKLAMNNLKIYKDIVYKQNAVVEKNKKLFYDECIESSATKLGDGNKCVLGVSLDEDIREKLTLIKMDIEGGEKMLC